MKIDIERHQHSRYGVDGTLRINNRRVCNTCEHPVKHLATGEYQVVIKRNKELCRKVPYIIFTGTNGTDYLTQDSMAHPPFIRIGNGPFRLHDGSIIVGQRLMTGVICRSAKSFNRLIDRLDKAQNRGERIRLIIK